MFNINIIIVYHLSRGFARMLMACFQQSAWLSVLFEKGLTMNLGVLCSTVKAATLIKARN